MGDVSVQCAVSGRPTVTWVSDGLMSHTGSNLKQHQMSPKNKRTRLADANSLVVDL